MAEDSKLFVRTVFSERYSVEGKLYLLEDGHYYVEVEYDGKLYGNRLVYESRQVRPSEKDFMENDIGWMSLEDLYTDILLEVL